MTRSASWTRVFRRMMRPGNAPARALRPGRSSSPGNRPEDGGPRAAPGFPPGGRDCMSPSSCVPGRTPRFRFCPWPPAWPPAGPWSGRRGFRRKCAGRTTSSGKGGSSAESSAKADCPDFVRATRSSASALTSVKTKAISRRNGGPGPDPSAWPRGESSTGKTSSPRSWRSSRERSRLSSKSGRRTWWTPFFSTPKPGRGKRSGFERRRGTLPDCSRGWISTGLSG